MNWTEFLLGWTAWRTSSGWRNCNLISKINKTSARLMLCILWSPRLRGIQGCSSLWRWQTRSRKVLCGTWGEVLYYAGYGVSGFNSCQGLPETWGKVLKVVTHGVGDRPSGSGPLRRDTGSGWGCSLGRLLLVEVVCLLPPCETVAQIGLLEKTKTTAATLLRVSCSTTVIIWKGTQPHL